MKKRRAEKRLSIEMKAIMHTHTDHGHIVWRSVYSPTGSGSHRTLIRREKQKSRLDSPRRRRVRATDVESASGTGPVMMLIGGSGTDVYIRNNLPTHAYILYSNVSLGS